MNKGGNRMYKKFTAVALFIFLIGGCATSQTRTEKYYTSTEFSKMTYCIGMSDTAMYVATEKLKKRPKEQLINYYSNKDNSRLNIATVDKVYSENFTNAWDYTIGFFEECAANLAAVQQSRVKFASYCTQNTLIADVAYANKRYGYPKEQAYEKFTKFKSKTPRQIVDKVYASDKGRAEIKLDVWNDCMTKISED
jgi:hypothetical protein